MRVFALIALTAFVLFDSGAVFWFVGKSFKVTAGMIATSSVTNGLFIVLPMVFFYQTSESSYSAGLLGFALALTIVGLVPGMAQANKDRTVTAPLAVFNLACDVAIWILAFLLYAS